MPLVYMCGAPSGLPSPKSRCTVTGLQPLDSITLVVNLTTAGPDVVYTIHKGSVVTVGQQLQISVVAKVSEHGVGSLHVAVMVTDAPQEHFEASVAVQVLPLITAWVWLPAMLGPQSTTTEIELL